MKNFEARNGNYERNAVVKNQGTKQREQRSLGDCWQWTANGQCSKGDNCSFRHDMNKRAKMTQRNPSPNSFMQQSEKNASRARSPRGKSPSGGMSRWPCKDYLKGTCTNSFCESGTLQNACSTRPRVVADLVKSARMHIVRLMKQPSKRSKSNDDKSAVAMLKKYDLHDRTCQPVVNHDKGHDRTGQPVVERVTRHELNHGPVGCRSSSTRQLGCVFQDMEPPKSSSILRKSSNTLKPIRCVRFTGACCVMLTFETKILPSFFLPR